jgi:enoyl-CoA hydratase/carnithine racemase
VITLDDPAHANAMTPEIGDAFIRAVREIQNHPKVIAVVIRGAGQHSSIGGHRNMLISLGHAIWFAGNPA